MDILKCYRVSDLFHWIHPVNFPFFDVKGHYESMKNGYLLSTGFDEITKGYLNYCRRRTSQLIIVELLVHTIRFAIMQQWYVDTPMTRLWGDISSANILPAFTVKSLYIVCVALSIMSINTRSMILYVEKNRNVDFVSDFATNEKFLERKRPLVILAYVFARSMFVLIMSFANTIAVTLIGGTVINRGSTQSILDIVLLIFWNTSMMHVIHVFVYDWAVLLTSSALPSQYILFRVNRLLSNIKKYTDRLPNRDVVGYRVETSILYHYRKVAFTLHRYDISHQSIM